MSKIKETNEAATPAAATSIKNFKSSSEVENFYRFIHDNKLREEAKTLVEMVLKKITPPKKRGRKKSTLQ
ncbi:MAG: hypothetical protein QF441_06705 [Bacteriovoracaceae bacterium]|jgi:hypothetical protein|nr:hypothetical protein [Halobacteriovoraceae bacterium]MDP7320281.1 hypothetical protein [Bacteriovoracaceae bacterium]|tara:strand:- start:2081 stop:2290 length:210 start_codon:yes stop_codon:yes gene_type:complete